MVREEMQQYTMLQCEAYAVRGAGIPSSSSAVAQDCWTQLFAHPQR